MRSATRKSKKFMKQKWFGVNRFWGWYPISWEGWIVVIGMVSSIVITTLTITFKSASIEATLSRTFPYTALLVSLTIYVASITGVKPAFGNKHSKNYSPDSPLAYLFLSFVTIPLILYYLIAQDFLSGTIFVVIFGLLYLTYRNLVTR